MPPSNYKRGRAFEYKTRDALRKRGAAYVMRAAQSKGAVDLLALWEAREELDPGPLGDDTETWVTRVPMPWLVQCKYSIHGGGTISPAERDKLKALAVLVGGVPIVATPGKNGRGVVFIDLAGGPDVTHRTDRSLEGPDPGPDHPL